MNTDSSLHVVVFPWLAFGHMLPYLELSQRLAARGHCVSFVSTPRNISRLPPLPPALAPLIDLVALQLPHIEGLPEGAEATSDIPYELFELHRKAFDGLAEPFSTFLDATCAAGSKKPDWLIVDFMHHWAAAAAQERKVPCGLLFLVAASFIVGIRQPSESPEEQHGATGLLPARASAFETERTQKVLRGEGASGISIERRFSLITERCKLVFLRSCLEFEPESVALVPELLGKPIVPLGLLPPSPQGSRGVRCHGAGGEQDDAIMSWLDGQPARSVIYVALGSEVPLSVELVRELALGLELAGMRFLWALRMPSAVPGDGTAASVLPEGFEERTSCRGLVTIGLAPQIRILARGSVGAFLTHCGWSSIIEGLQFGHPLVMLPIVLDQGPNARLMEGKKVGVQVARNEKDGSFDRNGVATAVRSVMVEEEGRVFAANAKKMQEIVADKEFHERCIDEFIQHLRSYMED